MKTNQLKKQSMKGNNKDQETNWWKRNKKRLQSFNRIKRWCFEKLGKIDNLKTKIKREKIQIKKKNWKEKDYTWQDGNSENHEAKIKKLYYTELKK